MAHLQKYRFKTLRLMRNFFEMLDMRLQVRELLRPVSSQFRELRAKLVSCEGDFSFMKPAAGADAVCSSRINATSSRIYVLAK